MNIEGKRNLEFLKRALLGHVVYCSIKATRATDKETTETWDPEIKQAQELLESIQVNLERENSPDDSEVIQYP